MLKILLMAEYITVNLEYITVYLGKRWQFSDASEGHIDWKRTTGPAWAPTTLRARAHSSLVALPIASDKTLTTGLNDDLLFFTRETAWENILWFFLCIWKHFNLTINFQDDSSFFAG